MKNESELTKLARLKKKVLFKSSSKFFLGDKYRGVTSLPPILTATTADTWYESVCSLKNGLIH